MVFSQVGFGFATVPGGQTAVSLAGRTTTLTGSLSFGYGVYPNF